MKKRPYFAETIILILYASAVLVIMYFHEPWFDEAQAWLIAQDASLVELLTSITHYEGHPPIWFLALMPFAKLGLPFEIGLKAVNFVFAIAAMGLLVFKAPFPRIVRCTIPFTYFFFYQYGVISRTYSMMMLGFVLSALYYKDRNDKPYQFAAALAVICGSSLYGIVICAGIALVWLGEMWREFNFLQGIKSFPRSKRFFALLSLLIFNILLLLSAYPLPDTYAVNAVVENNSNVSWLFYMLLIAPADAIFTSFFSATATNSLFDYLICGLLSYVIIVLLFEIAKAARMRALFLFPYLFFILFSGLVYFWDHHIGILVMFYLFIMWCCSDQLGGSYEAAFRNKYFRYFGLAVLALALISTLRWSVIAAKNDISLNYGTGREAAAFLKENRLDQLNIVAAWRIIADGATAESYEDYAYTEGIPAMAYFKENIFSNFNNKAANQRYLTHRIDTEGLYTKDLIAGGKPDVLFTNVHANFTLGDQIGVADYALVKPVAGHDIWKDEVDAYQIFIFLRKDLLDNYPQFDILNWEDELLTNEEISPWFTK
ncbi:MAG TPA: hypothetical protein DER60_00685 [Syntrophomonas sp.]|jgi:hypothetical protein|nr:hypothetical protein [Syntrophomonas sp.]